MSTKTPISRAIYDTNVARIKRDYADQPPLAEAVLAHLASGFDIYDPEPAPVRDLELTERDARIKNIIEMTGVDRPEAERRVNVADGTTPKTLADFAADPTSPEAIAAARYLLGSNYQGDIDAEPTEEQQAADMAAMWEAQKPHYVFPDGQKASWDRVQSGIDARDAAAKRARDIETAYRDTIERAPGVSDENARKMAETFVGPLPAAHAKRLAESAEAAGFEDTPEMRAWLGVRQKD